MDGVLEILVGSNDHNSYCLSLTQHLQGNATPWPSFMGSSFHTGWMDSDGDLLDDLTEHFYSTNISNPDSDDDGFLDGWEIQVGLNPLLDDTLDDKDGDGLNNYDEAKIYHTSLFNPDSDNDGLLDGKEINLGHNPLKWDNWKKLIGLYILPVWIVVPSLLIILIKKRFKLK